VAFDADVAGLVYLQDQARGVTWVDRTRGDEVIGLPGYLTWTEQDFKDYIANYTWIPPPYAPDWWFYRDVGRLNMSIYAPDAIHQLAAPLPVGLWVRNTSGHVVEFLMEAKFDVHLQHYYGAPATVWTKYVIPYYLFLYIFNVSSSVESIACLDTDASFSLAFPVCSCTCAKQVCCANRRCYQH
jgi:hypothetical protein